MNPSSPANPPSLARCAPAPRGIQESATAHPENWAQSQLCLISSNLLAPVIRTLSPIFLRWTQALTLGGETLDLEEKLLNSLPCLQRWLRVSPAAFLSFLSLLPLLISMQTTLTWGINNPTFPPCSPYRVIPDFVGHEAGALSTGMKKLQWESSAKEQGWTFHA